MSDAQTDILDRMIDLAVRDEEAQLKLLTRLTDLVSREELERLLYRASMHGAITPDWRELEAQFDRVCPDYRNAVIMPHKSLRGIPVQESPRISLASFDRHMATKELYAEFRARKQRPAFFHEALDYAKRNPNEQRHRRLIPLGSIIHLPENNFVACLEGDAKVRRLNVRWWDAEWDPSHDFPVVDLDA